MAAQGVGWAPIHLQHLGGTCDAPHVEVRARARMSMTNLCARAQRRPLSVEGWRAWERGSAMVRRTHFNELLEIDVRRSLCRIYQLLESRRRDKFQPILEVLHQQLLSTHAIRRVC